jgi:broad specificity phosphatase PhoE
MTLTPEQAGELGERAFDALVELHGVDVDAAASPTSARGRGYVGRQVAGWSDRYRRARTDNVPDFEAVMGWLADRQPEDVGTVLVHNDFRLDNLVLSDDLQVVGVLDWEMATLGDPLMDLGGALAYWVQADDDEMFRLSKRQPSDLPGCRPAPDRRPVRRAHRRRRHGLDVLRGVRAVPARRHRPADLLPLPPRPDDERGLQGLLVLRRLPRRALPPHRRAGLMPVVLLVRHGQASFGADDYDQLSDLGRAQAEVVGTELRRRALRDPLVVHGTLRRQRDTASLALPDARRPPTGRWDEYDHLDLLKRYAPAPEGAPPTTSREVQGLLDAALQAWVDDGDGGWSAFRDGAVAALRELVGSLPRGRDAVVFTSGGIVAAVCAELLHGGAETVVALNRVTVNGGITKLVAGSSGTSLVGFNDHAHLPADAVTYR